MYMPSHLSKHQFHLSLSKHQLSLITVLFKIIVHICKIVSHGSISLKYMIFFKKIDKTIIKYNLKN
jgi:hypothetical protein